MKALGKQVRVTREGRGLTHRGLAELAGCTGAYVVAIEQGRVSTLSGPKITAVLAELEIEP